MRRLALLLALLPACATRPPASDDPGREAADLLRELIRIDTINPPQKGSTRPNANETALCRRVKEILAADGIASEVIESAPGRGNLIARIKGTDASKKGLLMMAHVDVVNVDPDKWVHPPLEAVETNGYIWGRGALDDKGPAAVSIQAMRLVKRRGMTLSRDLVLMLNADEESSGRYGAEFMVEKHWDKIDCAFVVNEGGRIHMKDGRVHTFSIQSAEKIYNDIRIWIRGESGHSSVPRTNNSIYSLARALAKLEAYQAPVKVNATVSAALAKQAEREKDSALAALMRSASQGDLKAAEELAKRDVRLNASLRSTFVPTIIEGGIRENVLPPDAVVNVNIRLLPGEKLDDMIATLARVAGLPAYATLEVKPGEEWRAVLRAWMIDQEKRRRENTAGVFEAAIVVDDRGVDAPASPLENELYRAMAKAGAELSPEAVVTPMMSTGATDSRFFRGKGVPAYGILPLPATDEDLKGFHDHNERVAVSSVGYGVRLMMRIIEEVCR